MRYIIEAAWTSRKPILSLLSKGVTMNPLLFDDDSVALPARRFHEYSYKTMKYLNLYTRQALGTYELFPCC